MKIKNQLYREQNPKRTVKNNRGNVIDIKFVFPRQNSEDVLEEITAGLTYSGLFQGISQKR